MQLSMKTPTTPLTGMVQGGVGLLSPLAKNFRPRGGALAHACTTSSRRLGLVHARSTRASDLNQLKKWREEKSAYIEVLDYNRIVSFHDNQSLKEAIKRDLEEDLTKEGFQLSDIILQVQSTSEKFGGKCVDLRDQDVPDQAVIRGKLRQHKRKMVSKLWQ